MLRVKRADYQSNESAEILATNARRTDIVALRYRIQQYVRRPAAFLPTQRNRPLTRPKTLPEHERMAIAAEVVQLLSQVDELGRRRWTTVSLGQACGGLRHETIRLARSSAGVGPAVRDAIVQLTGLTMDQLLQKHHFDPGTTSASRSGAFGAFTPTPTFAVQSPSPSYSGAMAVPDRVVIGRQVIAALQADGFARGDAQNAVSEILFNEEVTEILELYRKGRAILEGKRAVEQAQATGARSVAEHTKAQKSAARKR